MGERTVGQDLGRAKARRRDFVETRSITRDGVCGASRGDVQLKRDGIQRHVSVKRARGVTAQRSRRTATVRARVDASRDAAVDASTRRD